MRFQRLSVALGSLLALGSCLQRDATAPENLARATLFIRADLSSTRVATLVASVTAPDIATPLVFNIPIAGGLAAGSISVLAGSSRTIALRAYDVGGVATHSGSATLSIQPGTNPPIAILLTPLAGDAPIQVTVGDITIAVGPASATLAPGDTASVTATIFDASGQAVAGHITWATFAPAVASVVSTGEQRGRVTAVGPGRATVVAIYGGVAGPAVIAVTNPLWPNEPAGWTVLTDYDMRAVNGGGWASAYASDSTTGRLSITHDPTGPLNTTAWQFYYAEGNDGLCGSSPGTEYFDFAKPVKQLYRGFWVKFSSPFSFAQDQEVHMAVSFTASYNGSNIVLDMSGPGDVYFVNGFAGNGGNFNIYPSRSPSWSLGGWHKVETLFSYTGGIVKAWVDGVLTVNAAGVYFPNDAGFTELQFSPTWGGCLPPLAPAFDSWIWINHVHVSTP